MCFSPRHQLKWPETRPALQRSDTASRLADDTLFEYGCERKRLIAITCRRTRRSARSWRPTCWRRARSSDPWRRSRCFPRTTRGRWSSRRGSHRRLVDSTQFPSEKGCALCKRLFCSFSRPQPQLDYRHRLRRSWTTFVGTRAGGRSACFAYHTCTSSASFSLPAAMKTRPVFLFPPGSV